ncbi:hypothetical protein ACFL6U_20140 [Planctomycetota bacterium]
MNLFPCALILMQLTGVSSRSESPTIMDEIAENYVRLVLEVGLYDDNYVDAYYGPEKWRPKSDDKTGPFPFADLVGRVDRLLNKLQAQNMTVRSDIQQRRKRYLNKQLTAVKGKIEMLNGKTYTFDEESMILYDAVAPTFTVDHFEMLVSQLDSELPGSGSISERFNKFQERFIIPKDKIEVTFSAALEESRRRTKQYINIPETEYFEVKLVTNKPYAAYNWYKGNQFSVIEINTGLPIFIDRAIDLACHEAYPGHHVYNALLEKQLYQERSWVEYCVYALFSPQSFIAEGTANFGIKMAFPAGERIQFDQDVLFPLAGLDQGFAEKYHRILKLRHQLKYANIEVARQFLDQKCTEDEVIQWIIKYSLVTPELAKKILQFIKVYRAYIINYSYGEDLIEKYVEGQGGTPDNPQKRWAIFQELISSPQIPSGLAN